MNSRHPGTCDLLLTGGTVVTMDDRRRVIRDGAVAVDSDRITAVGTSEELAHMTSKRRVDCRGKAVIPGFVDCHNHLFQLLGRGLGEGMALWPWLCEFMWPYSACITHDQATAGVRVAALEAARAGTTYVLDNHYAPSNTETVLAVCQAIEDVGLRGAVARGITGRQTEVASQHGLASALFQYSAADELAMTEECIGARRGSSVAVWPAPLNIIYVDQELVGASVELARKHHTSWHTHCSEAADDPKIYQEAYGIRPLLWLAAEGLLDRNSTLAHAIWLDDDEVEAAGAAHAGLSYNPQSNQYLASGAMRFRDVREAGATVGLGSDGSAGHNLDMFAVMRQAIYVQRLTTLDPQSVNAQTAFEMATRDGARYAGIDAGQLTAGKLADIAVVDLDKPHLTPVHDVVSSLVYSACGEDVRATVVGGEVIVEGGRHLLVDEREIMSEATGRAKELAAAMGVDA